MEGPREILLWIDSDQGYTDLNGGKTAKWLAFASTGPGLPRIRDETRRDMACRVPYAARNMRRPGGGRQTGGGQEPGSSVTGAALRPGRFTILSPAAAADQAGSGKGTEARIERPAVRARSGADAAAAAFPPTPTVPRLRDGSRIHLRTDAVTMLFGDTANAMLSAAVNDDCGDACNSWRDGPGSRRDIPARAECPEITSIRCAPALVRATSCAAGWRPRSLRPPNSRWPASTTGRGEVDRHRRRRTGVRCDAAANGDPWPTVCPAGRRARLWVVATSRSWIPRTNMTREARGTICTCERVAPPRTAYRTPFSHHKYLNMTARAVSTFPDPEGSGRARTIRRGRGSC